MFNKPSNIMKTRLPEDWSVHRFDEISDFDKKTVDPLKNPDKLWNYITISDIQDYRINSFQQIFGKEAPSRARKRVMNGDILVSTVRPYLKANAKIDERYENFICSTGFSVLSPKESVLSDYLYYFIQTDQFTNELMRRMVGATYPAVTSSDIKHLRIPVPPLVEQRGIVEVLGTVDECIRLTDAVIERAEELKRGLMQQLLTRGIGHTEYKETPLGIMPTKWKIMSLKEISTKGSQNGLYKSNNQGSPVKYVRMTELFKSDILTNELENTINVTKQEKEKFLLKNGDLLFGRRSFVVEGAGKCVLVYGLTSEAVFESSIIRFSLNDELIDPFFCLNWFLNNIGYREIRRIVRVVTVSGVTGKDLEKVKVPIPPLEEQKKISDIIKSVNKLISEEREKKHYLISVKTGLMQRLLPGTIRVELKGDGIQRIRDSREAYN